MEDATNADGALPDIIKYSVKITRGITIVEETNIALGKGLLIRVPALFGHKAIENTIMLARILFLVIWKEMLHKLKKVISRKANSPQYEIA